MNKDKRTKLKIEWEKIKQGIEILLILFISLISIYLIYDRSLPRRYDLRPGDTSLVDITSERAIVDHAATARQAREHERNVKNVMSRSAQLSNQYLSVLRGYLQELSDQRKQKEEAGAAASSPASGEGESVSPQTSGVAKASAGEREVARTEGARVVSSSVPTEAVGVTEDADSLLKRAEGEAEKTDLVLGPGERRALAENFKRLSLREYGFQMSDNLAEALANLPSSVFQAYLQKVGEMARNLLDEALDQRNLNVRLNDELGTLSENYPYYSEVFKGSSEILRHFLAPNVEFDARATGLAKAAAVAQAEANPVMIPRGTRIVSVGDIISEEQYQYLSELNLLDTGALNYGSLAGIVLIYLVLLSAVLYYLIRIETGLRKKTNSLLAIVLSGFLVLLASYYLFDYSGYVILLPFFAVLVSNFYGFRTGFVLSVFLSCMVSMMRFSDIGRVFAGLLTAYTSCAAASSQRHGSNYLKVILLSFLPPIPLVLGVGLILSYSSNQLFNSLTVAVMSSGLSAMAAIGFTPVIETLEAKVSPMKLTSLSHPGNPLLRRLFFEAPGTNQHSMMVANLAEAAAEAIGADALFCRVASYYHDIGKLDNPLMFTENQEGFNPHDRMTPEQSFSAIVAHVDAGMAIAKRYRLPQPIIDIIREHHGTTLLYYFYNKAVKLAEEEGREAPKPEDFRYPHVIPQSKESGIIMLADTVEAAVKSTQVRSTEEVRTLARRLLRQKNEQEQLIESKLSYEEVEEILLAFERVYQGQMHERVKYPEPVKNFKLHN